MPRDSRTIAYLTLEFLFRFLVLVFAVVFWINIGDLQFLSRVYPQLVILLLVAFVAVDLAIRLRDWRRGRLSSDVDEAYPEPDSLKAERRPAVVMVVTTLFVLATGVFSYYLAVIPYVALTLFVLGVRRVWILVLTPAAFLLISYFVFSFLLNMPLP